jgi:predicted HicB family RNase H-like nuclease
MVNEGFTAGALRPYRPAIMSMILPPAPGMSAFSASPCASSLRLQARLPLWGFFLPPSWRDVKVLLESHGAGVSFGIGRQIRVAWRGRRASLQIRADGAMAEAETNALLGLINGDSEDPARIGLRSAYPASVTFDPQLELFIARALAIPDLVMAAGRNRTQLACAFEIAVMDYQSFCKARGEEPALYSAGAGHLRFASHLAAPDDVSLRRGAP